LQARFLSGDYEQAIRSAKKAKSLLWSSFSHIQEPEYWYYAALSQAQISNLQDQETITLLKTHQKKLEEWAQTSPANFLNKSALVSAELSRIEKREFEKTLVLYHQAIDSARENGYVQNEAIANELAAKYLFSCDRELLAQDYLREARNSYERWGATAKVRSLEKTFPFLLIQSKSNAPIPVISTRPEFLDLLAATKASQAISSEIELEKLIEKLMHTVLEQAGAEKGFLLLVRNRKLGIEAKVAMENDEFVRLPSIPVAGFKDLPLSLIQYVERVKQSMILVDAQSSTIFSLDPYFKKIKPKSILCLPILRQAELVGLIYLENKLITNAFTPERLAVLDLLASQAAISLENATLYSDLKQADVLIGNSPTVLFRRRSEPGFPIDYVSGNVSRIFGYSRDELTSNSKNYLSMIHPEDREQFLAEIQEFSKKGIENFKQEYRLMTRDKKALWVDDRTAIERGPDGKVSHYQGIVIDISERKKIDSALRESEVRLSAILDNAGAVIYLKDIQGKYLIANRLFKRLFKVEDIDIIGKTDYDLFPTSLAEEFRTNDLEVLRSRKTIEFEEKALHEDGLHTYISIKFPLFDVTRAPYALCCISTDITERKRSEEERMHLISQLQDALAARDEFLSIASHELRTPLTSLKLQVQIIKQILRNPKISVLPESYNFGKMLEIADQQMDRLSKLINDLLDVSSIDITHPKLNIQTLDLVELIRGVMDRFRAVSTTAHCVLQFQSCPRALILGDRTRIEQVIENLLSNAIKYGAGKPVEVTITAEDDKAIVQVKDHGIGIEEKDQARIFERFERAVPSTHFGGLGLGLYISSQIISAHHGKIRVKSSPGQGTTFIVELPLASKT
jgi:PAS domain S-box-containing protein